MKIALVVEHFDSSRGGAEKYVWEFASWLVAQGHHVDVFTAGAYAVMPGVTMQHLHFQPFFGQSRQGRFAHALQKKMRGKAYDVVQGFNHVWPADVLMLHGGVHVAFEHYNALSAPTNFGRVLKRWVYRLHPKYMALRANEKKQFSDEDRHFVAVSQRVSDDMIRYYPSIEGRVHVVSPGVDLGPFSPKKLTPMRGVFRKKLGVDPGCRIWLFVSHNYRLKGLHDLIQALALVKQQNSNGELWVLGRGREASYRKWALQCGVADSIRFLGTVDDMREVYMSVNALVHPSYYDTFGGVCLEAMACGLPVAVSRNCGMAEWVDQGQGAALFEMPAPAAAIACAMGQVLDPACIADAQANNPERVGRHSRAHSFEAMMAVYQAISRST